MEGYSMKSVKFIFPALIVASLTAVHAAAPKKHQLEQTDDQPTQDRKKRIKIDHQSAKAPDAIAASSGSSSSSSSSPPALSTDPNIDPATGLKRDKVEKFPDQKVSASSSNDNNEKDHKSGTTAQGNKSSYTIPKIDNQAIVASGNTIAHPEQSRCPSLMVLCGEAYFPLIAQQLPSLNLAQDPEQNPLIRPLFSNLRDFSQVSVLEILSKPYGHGVDASWPYKPEWFFNPTHCTTIWQEIFKPTIAVTQKLSNAWQIDLAQQGIEVQNKYERDIKSYQFDKSKATITIQYEDTKIANKVVHLKIDPEDQDVAQVLNHVEPTEQASNEGPIIQLNESEILMVNLAKSSKIGALVWNLQTGICILKLKYDIWHSDGSGYSKTKFKAYKTPSNLIIMAILNSGLFGRRTIVIFDGKTQESITNLCQKNSDEPISNILQLSNGNIAAQDKREPNTINIWDLDTGMYICSFEADFNVPDYAQPSMRCLRRVRFLTETNRQDLVSIMYRGIGNGECINWFTQWTNLPPNLSEMRPLQLILLIRLQLLRRQPNSAQVKLHPTWQEEFISLPTVARQPFLPLVASNFPQKFDFEKAAEKSAAVAKLEALAKKKK